MGQALGLHEQVTSTARNFSVHSNRSRNQSSGQMGVSIVMGVPQNCWFIMEKKPINMDDLGVPWGTPILGNLQMALYQHIPACTDLVLGVKSYGPCPTVTAPF